MNLDWRWISAPDQVIFAIRVIIRIQERISRKHRDVDLINMWYFYLVFVEKLLLVWDNIKFINLNFLIFRRTKVIFQQIGNLTVRAFTIIKWLNFDPIKILNALFFINFYFLNFGCLIRAHLSSGLSKILVLRLDFGASLLRFFYNGLFCILNGQVN